MSYFPHYIGTKVAAPPLQSYSKVSIVDVSSDISSVPSIEGKNVTYYPYQIVNTLISRIPNSDVNDTLPDVTRLLSHLSDLNTSNAAGTNFNFCISNETNYSITLIPGKGCIMYPSKIMVPFKTLTKFNVVITSNTPTLKTYIIYQVTNVDTTMQTKYASTIVTNTSKPKTILSIPVPLNGITNVSAKIVTHSINSDIAIMGDIQLQGTFQNINGNVKQIGNTILNCSNKVATLLKIPSINLISEPNIDASYSIKDESNYVNINVKGMLSKITPSDSKTICVPKENWNLISTNERRVLIVNQSDKVDSIRTKNSYTTLSSAVKAANPGDIIEIAENTTINEKETIHIKMSLEIRGVNRETSRVSTVTSKVLIKIMPGVKNVWIHDLSLVNETLGGFATVIDAQTVNENCQNGSEGLRFENLNISHKETGIVIGGKSWVISNCYFTYRPITGEANESVHIINYQTFGICFITLCTFDATIESIAKITFIYVTSMLFKPFMTGHSGSLIVSRNTQLLGNLANFIMQDSFKQPGLISDSVHLHALDLYIINNKFGITSEGNIVMYETEDAIAPLDFFNVLHIDNSSGMNARSSTDDTADLQLVQTNKNKYGFITLDGVGKYRLTGEPLKLSIEGSFDLFGSSDFSNTNASTIDNAICVNVDVYFPIVESFQWKCVVEIISSVI